MAFELDAVKDDPDFKKFIDTTVQSAIDTAVGELKTKNSELLGEKKKLQEMLGKMDGIDPEAARKALAFLDNNKIAKLIAEGKTEEALSTHTEKLTAKFQEQIAALNKQAEDSNTSANSYRSRFEQSVIDNEITRLAAKHGILPDAITDVLARARNTFSYGEDGTIEARDKAGNLVKVDDKILTTEMWVKSLPRHYWPASEGAGATGGKGDDSNELLATAASSGDLAKYRQLRQKGRKK
jgi:hypothetical protein